jgi:uncharacterized protein DUF6085
MTTRDRYPKVQGWCPMGCGNTLFLGAGGYITCSSLDCPTPDAVTAILDDHEIHHTVRLRGARTEVQHPLRERLAGDLFVCRVMDLIQQTRPDGRPADGFYRVVATVTGLNWEAVTPR